MRFLAGVATPLLASFLAAAQAQAPGNRIEDRFEPKPKPLSEPGTIIPSLDSVSPPDGAHETTFVLQGINVVGNTVVGDDEFSPFYEALLGTTVSLAQVFALADRFTALYSEKGYPLSKAIVPAQEIGDDGSVTIRVIEGFIAEVELDQEADVRSASMLSQHAEKISLERPISSRTLERHVLLADDLPGVSVRAALRRAEGEPGAVSLVLVTGDEPRASGSFQIDNRGSNAVGPVQLQAAGAIRNLLHPNSETSIRAVNASWQELKFASVQHRAVLTSQGTSVKFGLRYSDAEPGGSASRSLEQENEATTVSAEVRHPWIRSRSRNLQLYGMAELRNSSTALLDTAIARDRVRSLRVGVDFDRVDESRALDTAAVEFSKGLPGLGANDRGDPLKSRASGRADYRKVTVELSRTQPLGILSPDLSAWSVRGSVMVQHSWSPLLASEECGLGGTQYGRAFDSSTLSGDRCRAVSFELRRRLEGLPGLDSTELYGFFDAG